MKKIDNNTYEVHIQGHHLKLYFYPGQSTGNIKDGVGFQFERGGVWVIPYQDLLEMVMLARDVRRKL